MELEKLQIVKDIVSEMIKTKKSLDKAVKKRGDADVYGLTRASVTTMDANIHKNAKLLEDYKPHLVKAVGSL